MVALLATACVDSGGTSGTGYGTYGPIDCRQFTSCATCTPVLGCGWCSTGTKGACVDQPNACAGTTAFTWTWELNYCPAPAGGTDAGGSPSDAGSGDGGIGAADTGAAG